MDAAPNKALARWVLAALALVALVTGATLVLDPPARDAHRGDAGSSDLRRLVDEATATNELDDEVDASPGGRGRSDAPLAPTLALRVTEGGAGRGGNKERTARVIAAFGPDHGSPIEREIDVPGALSLILPTDATEVSLEFDTAWAVSRDRELLVAPIPASHEVVLCPLAALEIEVLEVGPLGSAVIVERQPYEHRDVVKENDRWRVLTEPGTTRWPALLPGLYEVRLVDVGDAEMGQREWVPREGEPTAIEVELVGGETVARSLPSSGHPEFEVSGLVARGGVPLQWVQVSGHCGDTGSRGWAWTDEGGRYSFTLSGPGTARVELTEGPDGLHVAGSAQAVELAARRVIVDFDLPGTEVRGRVVRRDESIASADRAHLTRHTGSQGPLAPGSTVTELELRSGEYVVTGLSSGWYRVRSVPDRTRQKSESFGSVEFFLPPGDRVLRAPDLVLEPAVPISGRVVLPDPGGPIEEGTWVTVTPARDPIWGVTRALVDEDGAWSARVPPGRYLLRASYIGFGHRSHIGLGSPSPTTIEVPGENSTIELAVEPLARGVTLRAFDPVQGRFERFSLSLSRIDGDPVRQSSFWAPSRLEHGTSRLPPGEYIARLTFDDGVSLDQPLEFREGEPRLITVETHR